MMFLSRIGIRPKIPAIVGAVFIILMLAVFVIGALYFSFSGSDDTPSTQLAPSTSREGSTPKPTLLPTDLLPPVTAVHRPIPPPVTAVQPPATTSSRALSDTEVKPMAVEVTDHIPDSDVDRLRGHVVRWLLENCADNRPGEEANFRHYQLAGFSTYEVHKTDDTSWTFTSGTETWNITKSPTLQVQNPHGNSWCLR